VRKPLKKLPICSGCGQDWPTDQRACPNCGNLMSVRSGPATRDLIARSYANQKEDLRKWESERSNYIAPAKCKKELEELYG